MKQRIVVIAVLGGLVALYAGANHLWLREGASLYGRDVVGHLQLTAEFHHHLQGVLRETPSPAGRLMKIIALFHEESLPFHHAYIWPKLVHILTALVCLALGLSLPVMIHTNLIFFAILIVSTYLIGRRCHSRNAGLFAAILVALYPAVFGQSRKFGLDFPLTAMTALALYVLLRAENFQKRGFSIVLGIILGLGILTKGQIVFYAGPPLIFCAVAGLARRESRAGPSLVNLILCAAIALTVSALWWWGIIGDLWRAYFATVTDYPFSWAHAYKNQPPLTLRWLLFHAIHCAISTSPLFFVVLIVAIPSFLRARIRGKAVLLLWILGPYAIWTLSNIKRDTDFFPCLPAVALVTSIGVLSWRRGRLKRAAVAACILMGLLQYFSVSFSRSGFDLWSGENPYDKPREPDGYNTPFHPPWPNNYKAVMDRFSEAILNNGHTSRYARIGLIETAGPGRWLEYNPAILEYYFRLNSPGGFIYRSRFMPGPFLQHARSLDYLIVMDGRNESTPDWGELESFYADERWRQLILDYLGSPDALNEVIESFKSYTIVERGTLLPEGSGIYLLTRGPLRVVPGAEIPASSYCLSNLITTPTLIGAHNVPRHAPRVREYDSFFPHWLRYPFIDGDLRHPGDPYFCEYDLEFAEGGTYRLSVCYASDGGAPVMVFWDGELLLENALEDSTGGRDGEHVSWTPLASLTVPPGRHMLGLVGEKDFPLLAAIRFDRR